jgi:outer membrane protein assembly factor BamA
MNGLRPRLAILLAGCAFLASIDAASGQSQSAEKPMPPSAYKLISVTVSGSNRFTSDEVGAASGLPVGTIAHEYDFKKAARQLGESGAFSQISYKYSYSAEGTNLQFQVSDAAKFVPARFTDFVWFNDEELRAAIHERVPLFNGELPTTGRLPDQVSDVLQALLVERHIPGHVEYQRREAKNGQLESFDYDVAGVSIRIHRAEFPGAGASEMPELQAAAEKMINREYSRDYMMNFVVSSVLPILYERGFLKATCATPQPKVVKPPNEALDLSEQPRTYVDVTFPVTPGVEYKLKQWEWSGNKEIPASILDPLIHAKVGKPANKLQLHDDLVSVQQLYGSRGYVAVSIKVDADFDDASGMVGYRLQVTEGPVFHMGELQFRGLDNILEARLRAAWKLRPGDVYDSSYLQEYLPAVRKLLPTTVDWDVTSHVTPIPAERTVDVDLIYAAKATR